LYGTCKDILNNFQIKTMYQSKVHEDFYKSELMFLERKLKDMAEENRNLKNEIYNYQKQMIELENKIYFRWVLLWIQRNLNPWHIINQSKSSSSV
jgi:hypothetical protein